MIFECFIPNLPPGLNQTYGVTSVGGKARMYKNPVALQWAEKASLVIGAKAGEIDWKDDSKEYEIIIQFNNWRMDTDGPVKLVQDTLATKLGFNDKKITKQSSERTKGGVPGVLIILKPYERTQNS